MNRHLTLTFTLLLTGQADLTFAQENGQNANRQRVHLLMRILDLDRDGTLSRNEWEQIPAFLEKLDKNGDSVVSRDEMRPEQERDPARTDRRRQGGPSPIDIETSPVDLGEPGIAWYGRLDVAKEVAKRSNRPIMFMAAASQCGGVPGVF